MNGKELLFEVLRHHDTPRVPWVPFAGIHAGKLANYTAQEILMDGDKLFKSLMEVNKIYRPDGQPVLFDLQMEAEILGCELLWAEYAPPSVMSHPLENTKTIPCSCTIPEKTDGRLPMALDVMRRMKEAVGETTALYGLTTGPLTLASHLRGTNLFRDMRKDGEYVKELFNYCNEVNKAMADYYIEAGMDVIAAVDPVLSQISAKHFETYLMDCYTDLFNHIREKGAFAAFFVCGDATRNIEVMCQSGPDCIAVDENVNMAQAKEITDKYNIALCGNIPLTTTMLFGTQQDNMKYALEMLDTLNHHNLIIAPGCDMPYDIPIENTVGVVQALHEPEQVREILKNYEAPIDEDVDVELPDYNNLPRPLVEAYTLDSASCAACTYMYAAAMDVKKHFGDKVDVVEYKYINKEDIPRFKKLGIQHLPSLLINGELKYSSIIPERQELFDEVEKLLNK
ncbi:MAG: thioredoxin family protein [Firmicutes bacterium]|nr:thioredoxin family protein [Bacillota bacterium]